MAGNFESFSFPPGAGTSSSNSLSRRIKFGQFLLQSSSSSPPHHYYYDDDDEDEEALSSTSSSSSRRRSNDHDYRHHRISSSSGQEAGDNSPFNHNNYTATSSPWANGQSPYITSPWVAKLVSPDLNSQSGHHHVELIGSLVREEGHVYSLAASPRFLYTGSDSKNIRVWSKDRLRDSGGFKSGSGLVKSIVIWRKGHKIFTGHQDGKIRVWRSPESGSSTEQHKRVGSLPTWKDCLRSWLDPSTRRRKGGGGVREAAVVTVRRNGRKVPRVRHFDAVSCLSLNEDAGILYSASWDKTVKVWRLKDNKCLESIWAHDDAVNAVAVGFDGLVFSGSADGTVKVWRREMDGERAGHFYVQTLLEQASAVTSLAVSPAAPGGTSATVYAGTSDGLVNFWEWEKQLSYGGVLRGHKLAVLCLSTAGSTLVLSGSADSTICVWRREPGGVHTCLSVLTGHSGPVKCLAVEEDSSTTDDEGNDDDDDEEEEGRDGRWRLYSGSLDKSVKVWVVRG